MNKEKDFFKTCFDTIARLEVKNESQAIAKEVVLSEIERLQQENKKLNGAIQTYDILLKANVEENKQLKEAIKKAVLELANIDGNLSNSQLSDRICNLIDILKEVLE